MTSIADAIEDLVHRLTEMKEEVTALESQRDELRRETAQASQELAAKNAELATAEHQVEDMKRVLPDELDGAKVEGSMLATMMSGRWSEGMRGEDGSLFLDLNPDAFEEVAEYLRSRRLNPAECSNFSSGAVKLASFLGMPIDNIRDGTPKVASYGVGQERFGRGLAFSVALPRPYGGLITSLDFTVTTSTTCAVYTKEGSFEESLSAREDWDLVWTGQLEAGRQSVAVKAHLTIGQARSFYIHCGFARGLRYLQAKPKADELLILHPGRGLSEEHPFLWPPPEGDWSCLMTEHRYFAGQVKYTCYQP